MANNNGTYGTKRGAFIAEGDYDIYYKQTDSISNGDDGWEKMDDNILIQNKCNNNILPGVFSLNLPLATFNKKGIYNILITPKETKYKIENIGNLFSYPDVRGVVISDENIENNSLVGCRIEYCDVNYDDNDNPTKNGNFTIITSNFKVSSVDGSSYVPSSQGSLVFCTVTPSVSFSYSNTLPDIGVSGKACYIVKTTFNPVLLEIELTEHDIETLSTMLEGDQIRNLDKGLITTFNSDGEIYHQASYGNIVTKDGDGLNHDFKINMKDSIEFDEETSRNIINSQV